MSSNLFAQAAGGEGAPNPFLPMFIVGLMVLFWVVVIIPAGRRQKKEQEKMLAGLKRGSKVLTGSGIVGTVVTLKDGEDEIVIRSEDARLRVKRSAVQAVIGTDDAEAAK
ncbi:MAG: preprotein translocase subunit YajC [Gemmataceae bacterium]